MEKSYRIRTDIGIDKSITVKMQKNIDLYEILSLKLKSEKAYKLQTSNYGVIVGRILANNAMGIQNAKISIFIKVSDNDKLRDDLTQIYSYESVTSRDVEGRRYNLLPSENKYDDCYKVIGTFPSKRMILDNDSVLEIYDKYWKYTTTTNQSGDYMIFGVPVGNQKIHVDIDLSDIGILSQKPRDLVYKGYDINLFDGPSEFKYGTNLDNLAQVISQDETVKVSPFWGSDEADEISITRKDVDVQYLFETTCVFIGSTITDNFENVINHKCEFSNNIGNASQLTTSEGTIEMIRKNISGNIEEYPIQGNNLIDGNGVWCYQIPMNLDFIGTDEYGNIIPTNDPAKGIPTRASVRFRFTLDDNGDETMTKHKARYLVPCNPPLIDTEVKPYIVLSGQTESANTISPEDYYEFGSNTPDNCFRDLYWNKIYTVKSYIPRIQNETDPKFDQTTGIHGINASNAQGINPFPYNKMSFFQNMDRNKLRNNRWGVSLFTVFQYSIGIWFNRWKNSDNFDATKFLENNVDVNSLDFYNDWVNGCLYFPLWFWSVRKKNKYKKGDNVFASDFCNCDIDDYSELNLVNTCSLEYANDSFDAISYNNEEFFDLIVHSEKLKHGLIKQHVNSDLTQVYYYTFGDYDTNSVKKDAYDGSYAIVPYQRLFSTDIVLLGSLNDCDINGVPQFDDMYPSTTCNIPPISPIYGMKRSSTSSSSGGRGGESGRGNNDGSNRGDPVGHDEDNRTSVLPHVDKTQILVSGMNWGEDDNYSDLSNIIQYSAGMFFGIKSQFFSNFFPFYKVGGNKGFISYFYTLPKSCVNLERICELSTTGDMEIVKDRQVTTIGGQGRGGEGRTGTTVIVEGDSIAGDGMITSSEVNLTDVRAMFATLNNNKLVGTTNDKNTGYKFYGINYLYPSAFDGRLNTFCSQYSREYNKKNMIVSSDDKSEDYIFFRTGAMANVDNINDSKYFRSRAYMSIGGLRSENPLPSEEELYYDNYSRKRHFYYYQDGIYAFPLYENSYYFYFGLKNGSTAIDLLTKNFFRKCSNNNLAQFSMKLTTTPNSCQEEGKGIIQGILLGVGYPYTCELYDNQGKLFKDKPIQEGNIFTYKGLDNGSYTVIVTDGYQRVISKETMLEPSKISMTYTATDLKKDEYENICEEDYGTIVINTININNEPYKIDSFSQSEETYGTYELVLSKSSNSNDIEINKVVTFNFTDPIVNIEDYLCEQPSLVDNTLIFKVKKPWRFKIHIREVGCDDIYGENYEIVVNEPLPLNITINTIPMKFLIDKTSYYDALSSNSYSNVSYGNFDNTKQYLKDWFTVNDEVSYSFPALSNSEVWMKYIDSSNVSDILYFKLNGMLSLSNGVFISNGQYNEIVTEDDYFDNTLVRRVVNRIGGDGVEDYLTLYDNIKCEDDKPHVVGSNYLISGNSITTINKPVFNTLYTSTEYYKVGYYYSIFSNGGCIGDNCQRTDLCMYNSVPDNSDSLDGVCRDASNQTLDSNTISKIVNKVGNYNPYFRVIQIDRRFDYDVIVMTPYNELDAYYKGRISGFTYNGIEMMYDNDKNIISKTGDTEYQYNTENATISLNTAYTNNHPAFYKTEIKYSSNDGDSIDITKDLSSSEWGTNSSIAGLNGRFSSTNYPAVRYIDERAIPYGNEYVFNNVSCSYNVDVEETEIEIIAKAKSGETVSFTVSNMTPLSYTTVYPYNIHYSYNSANTTCTYDKMEISFNVNNIQVDANHSIDSGSTKVYFMKVSGATMSEMKNNNIDIDNFITSHTNMFSEISVNGSGNYEYTGTSMGNYNTVGVMVDYKLNNSVDDHLTKRIRVINTSTIYKLDTFKISTNYNELNGVLKITLSENDWLKARARVVKGYVTVRSERKEFISSSISNGVITIQLYGEQLIGQNIKDYTIGVVIDNGITYYFTIGLKL